MISVHTQNGLKTVAETRYRLSNGAQDVGMRNANPRMECLGDALTAEQAAAIAAGTFEGMFVGGYWIINGINWRIAHFNYWLGTGDTPCITQHAVIVPDTCLYNAQMHNTASGSHEVGVSNTTAGGYVGSDMRKTGLERAKEMAIAAFGEGHILKHREILANAVTNGRPSSGVWCDSTVELMNEPMAYGSYIFTPGNDGVDIPYRYTIDKTQLALFTLCPDLICNRTDWWLRDVVSDANFAYVINTGYAGRTDVSYPIGVRPVFGIC